MASASTIKIDLVTQVKGSEQVGQLTIKLGDLEKAAQAAARAAGKAKSFIDDIVFSMGAMSSTVSGLSTSLEQLSQGYRSFDQSMRAANTMAGKSGKDFDALKESVKGLAKEIPLAREVLADGLYQVISNGVPEDNWISYLEASARASVGGIADLGKTVTVTSTIIKNYGLTWDQAASIQDKIQLTAKNGVTSFEQLAAALPRVTGNAATLGVSIDELMAVFSTLTGVSGNTAEVSTQLAAVFTSLVKPTSEASRMAAQMGLQFNAAAIQAAGGFQNFLTQLQSTVATYAASSGMLEQEIYGKLFGSAEALRALGPLTGELAAKFSENVAAMADSAGTIDQAFVEMSTTADAMTQRMRNMMAALTDFVGRLASAGQPYVTFIAMTTQAIGGIGALIKFLRDAIIYFGKYAKALEAYIMAASKTVRVNKDLRASTQAGAAAFKAATAATVTFKVALRSLLITSGIGLAIWGLCEAVNALCGSFGKAEKEIEPVEKELSAVEKALQSSQDAFTSEGARIRAEISGEIMALKELIDSHADAGKSINALNQKYGESFGYHQTAAEWYDTLTEKAETYALAMAYQAKIADLMRSKAEKQMEIDANKDRMADLPNGGVMTEQEKEDYYNGNQFAWLGEVNGYKTKEAMTLELGNNVLKNEIADIDAEIERATGHMKELRDSLKLKSGVAGGDVPHGDGKAKTRLQEIQAQQQALTEEYQTASVGRKAAIETEIAALNIEEKKIRDVQTMLSGLGLEKPSDTSAYGDVPSFTPGTEVVELDFRIAPQAAADAVGTIGEVRAAVSALTEELNSASAEEIPQIQKAINALNAKGSILTGISEVPGLEDMLARFDGLDGMKLRAELELIGVDRLKEAADLLRTLASSELVPEEMREQYAALAGNFDSYIGKMQAQVPVQQQVSQGMQGISQMMGSVAQNLQGQAQSWVQWGAQLLSTVASAIPAIVALTQAQREKASVDKEGAVAGAANSAASIPVVGWIMAGVAVASMISAMMSIPKFATGGIAYGPTLGLFGEYAGAANNPEVVAPLSRLRELIGYDSEGVPGRVEFTFRRGTVRGALEHDLRRSRRGR